MISSLSTVPNTDTPWAARQFWMAGNQIFTRISRLLETDVCAGKELDRVVQDSERVV